ncbi:hypothetical protein BV898_15757 [Hypsibius exemplaris]|uniref:Receptor ligand binding region domain-containing protein n=1 Tax=Hypsibius exemplaris TaxID=2072580 RepID=A0A9X6NC85_HYPEX|nr:hypothetical protein BV898_15757 [Hypsibius exemplaris]
MLPNALFIVLHAGLLVLFPRGIAARLTQVDIACPGYTSIVAEISLPLTGPAYEAAVNESNALYAGIFNFTFTYLVDPVNAGGPYTLFEGSVPLIAPWYYRSYERSPETVRAIITPGSIDPTNVHQLAANWNIITMITSGSGKSQYRLPAPVVIGLSFTPVAYTALIFVDILRLFNWATVFLMRTVSSANVSLLNFKLRAVLTEFRGSSRVMIFLARDNSVRELMLVAQSLDMTTGDFVYLAYDPTAVLKVESFTMWKMGKKDDDAAKEAFRSLLMIHVRDEERQLLNSERVQLMKEQVRVRSEQEFNVTLSPANHPPAGMVNAYRSIQIFAQVLNESKHQHGVASLFNGYNLSRMFLDRTFPSDLFDIFIDGEGNRRMEFAVSYFAADMGGQRRVLLQQAKREGFRLERGQNISSSWPNGKWPPPNEPKCGYANEKSICNRG